MGGNRATDEASQIRQGGTIMKKQRDSLSKDGKRFTLCVPRDTFDALSERAKQEQTSVSAIVRKLIIYGLANGR